MSHPEDLAVGSSEVSSCFIPVQQGGGAGGTLSPSPHPRTLPTMCTLHLGREQALSSIHSSRGQETTVRPELCTLTKFKGHTLHQCGGGGGGGGEGDRRGGADTATHQECCQGSGLSHSIFNLSKSTHPGAHQGQHLLLY